MTNHPRRQHDDEAPESGAPVAGMPAAPPAAFSPNGHTPTARLIEQLPQMLAQALASVLMQVPVRTTGQQRACAACLTARVTWEHGHEAVVAEAREKAAHAAGNPDMAGLDFTAFLPPDLRPGAGEKAVPEVRQAVTTAQGTEVCVLHLPGIPQAARPYLIAAPAMTTAMLNEMMRVRAA